MGAHSINKNWLTIEIINDIVSNNTKIELSEEATELVVKCRTYLDNKMSNHDKPIYGINTGFGSLCNTEISNKDLSKLQKNLVMRSFRRRDPLSPFAMFLFLFHGNVVTISFHC